MSFLTELKRRNVVRVGIAYVVGAWLLLQLADVLSELLNLPETFGPIVVAAVAIGLPIVLFFAWAYELTPEGVKRESEVDRSQTNTARPGRKLNAAIFVMMAIALAYFIWESRFAGNTPADPVTAAIEQTGPDIEASPAAGGADRQSIAVLPFDNRSRLEEDEFFVEGIHDDLLTTLARIGSLKVISRTSMGKYRDTDKTIPEIASELGVATVMEGAVQRAGNSVRINVQLIDAQTDEHLWAEIFDRELTVDNLFAIQSEISQKIAESLQATLTPEEQQRLEARPTENLAAYNAYLRGITAMARRSSEGVDKAAEEFQRAVGLDPEFGLAWATLADVAFLQVQYSNRNFMDALEQRQKATERALALDDRLGEAHLNRAAILEYETLYEEAEAAFRKAIGLSPGNSMAHMRYAGFLQQYPHRLDEALAMIRKAVELDPLSSINQVELADIYLTLGRYGDAERQIRKVMELDPEFAPALMSMSELMDSQGRFDESARWKQRAIAMDPGRMTAYMGLLFTYMNMGNTEALAEIRTQMEAISDEHVILGWADMLTALYNRNFPAALEAANWTWPRMGHRPMFQGFFSVIYNVQGRYAEAREAFEASEPRLFDRAQWRSSIEDDPQRACRAAWILVKTGDEEMGRDLLEMSLAYIEDELPNYMDHADRYQAEYCHVVAGDYEKALDSIEEWVEHGHYAFWFFTRIDPQFEPLWGHPRFEAAMAQIEADLEAQRENVAAWKAEGQL